MAYNTLDDILDEKLREKPELCDKCEDWATCKKKSTDGTLVYWCSKWEGGLAKMREDNYGRKD